MTCRLVFFSKNHLFFLWNFVENSGFWSIVRFGLCGSYLLGKIYKMLSSLSLAGV